MSLIDTHCHLDDPRFAADLDAVLSRATATGVVKIVGIGTDVKSSRAALEFSQRYPQLPAVVGIHPNHLAEMGLTDWDELVALAGSPGVVGIGESGLDKHWDTAPFELQREYFGRHLELARVLNLPIVIHNREADAETTSLLTEQFDRHGPIQGILHSCAADEATVRACLAIGLHISFSGMITYKKADAIRAVAAVVPKERLLIETDAPYLAPVPVRGQRNEPAFVVHTAAALAAVRGWSIEETAAITTRNACELFRV